MKKITALFLTFAMVLSFASASYAIYWDAYDKYQAEDIYALASAEDIAEKVSGNIYENNAAMMLKGNGAGDYYELAVPVLQKGKYEIVIGVRKGPDAPKIRLYFPDINQYVGDEIDLYAEKEAVEEIKIADWYLDTANKTRQFDFQIKGKNEKSSGYNMAIDWISIKYIEKFVATSAVTPYFDDVEAPVVQTVTPDFKWGQVYESGTGCTTHVVFHPTEKNLLYIGTDMGGCYRWDNDKYRWYPISDNIGSTYGSGYGNNDFSSCDALALDPNNPDIIYVAYGLKSRDDRPGGIVKSYDRGNTWVHTGFYEFFGANDTFRHMREAIQVDPQNSNIVYFATQRGDLYKSNDGITTWEKITNVPYTGERNVTFPRGIIFDTNSYDENGTKRIYVVVRNYGIIVTEDAGKTWNRLEGSPEHPYNMEIADDGTLLVTTENVGEGLWKYKEGKWENIAPDNSGTWHTAAIDSKNPDYMITVWYHGPTGSYNEWVYVTTDGGKNWELINDRVEKSFFSHRPEASAMFCNVSDIAMDPYNPSRVFMAGWNQLYMTEDIFAENTKFINYSRGIEHGVPQAVVTPPTGANLFVVALDYGGGRFTDITQYMEEQLFPKGAPKPTAFMESNPNFIVRAARKGGGFSTNNGIDWKYFDSMPNDNKDIGSVAVSCKPHHETGEPVIYMSSAKNPLAISFDYGTTWEEAQGIPVGSSVIQTDKNDPAVVYGLIDKVLYKSEDYGRNFTAIKENLGADLETSWNEKGTLWAIDADGKLVYSDDGGKTFTVTTAAERVDNFALGKEEKEGDDPAIYIMGKVDGTVGVFRSTDNGKSWVCYYDDDKEPTKLVSMINIGADRQYFGLVYIASNGRGIHYGYPSDKTDPFYANREHEIQVIVNKQPIIFDDTEPKLINDRTMVPMRRIFECMGAKVEWDEATQKITATRRVWDHWRDETTVIEMQIGSKTMYVNGEAKEMDVAPILDGDRTLIPVRFISESFDAKVDWDNDNQYVFVEM